MHSVRSVCLSQLASGLQRERERKENEGERKREGEEGERGREREREGGRRDNANATSALDSVCTTHLIKSSLLRC